METLVQISDTHLSPTYGFFCANFLRAVDEINALAPDLVINTGDVALSGPDHADDLPFAAWAHAHIAAPKRYIPGNHDIGEEPGGEILKQPINKALVTRYRNNLGADYWSHEIEDWTLIGLNTQILGTGRNAEAEQADWLSDVLNTVRGRPIGIFIHKPLLIDSADEVPEQSWTVSGEARDALLGQFKAAGVRFVASGHMHQYKEFELDGIRMIWAPSTAYLTTKPQPGTDIVLGYLVYRFDGGDVSVKLRRTEGAEPLTFYDFFDPAVHGGLKDVPPSPPHAAEKWLKAT